MAYIATTDITDSVISAFNSDTRTTTWLAEVDGEIDGLAESLDVDEDDIYTTTLHPMVKQLCKALYGKFVCRDNMGVNNLDTTENDKYMVKYQMYSDEVQRLRGLVTAEMLTDTDGELVASERARGTIIWLG